MRIVSLSEWQIQHQRILTEKCQQSFCSKRTHSHMQNLSPPTKGSFKVDGGDISSTHREKITWNQKMFLWKMSESSSNQQFLSSKNIFFSVVQLSNVFFVVSVPIHWLHAYTTASACLRGMERVPTREFS